MLDVGGGPSTGQPVADAGMRRPHTRHRVAGASGPRVSLSGGSSRTIGVLQKAPHTTGPAPLFAPLASPTQAPKPTHSITRSMPTEPRDRESDGPTAPRGSQGFIQ